MNDKKIPESRNNKNRKKQNSHIPWKRITSLSMAILLVMTVILSSHLSSVLAEEDIFSSAPAEAATAEETADAQNEVVQFNPAADEETQPDEQQPAEETTEEAAELDLSGEERLSFDTETDSQDEEDITLETSGESDAASDEELSMQTEESEFSDGTEEAADALTAGAAVVAETVTVQKSDGTVLAVSAAQGTGEKAYTGEKNVVFDYNITADSQDTTQNSTLENASYSIAVSDCGIMSDDTSLEIWHISGEQATQITASPAVSEGCVSFSAAEFGEYIAVSNVATVDLMKGDVTVTEDALKGTRQDGTEVSFSFSDDEGRKYRISQSDQNTRCKNTIEFSTSQAYTRERTLILDGINTEGEIKIPAYAYTVMAKLLLRNINQVHRVYYGTGTANEMENANRKSSLTINDYAGNGKTEGELYVPYKMDTREEEKKYVLTNGPINVDWSRAGIGGGREKECKSCTGLTIAGGKIRVLVQNQNGATAIGGGGNGDAQLSITGGDITAICSSTGTAIGGGIGWINRGGNADISITGGTIYAENMDQYTRDGTSYGGVAIGSGSSMMEKGNKANIKITGGTVTAYARYGNGIGSGNSYQTTAAEAEISISGNANVTTNALGGGTSKENQGGNANIQIADEAVVNCVKYSAITDKWDTDTENILGAFGIGGGNSAESYDGGSATVTVIGGSLNCNGGNIGGGAATGTGNGGTATINVSGGTLTSIGGTIGGGSAISGAGGNASINVSGGILDCTSVGGGNSDTGTPGAVTGTSDDSANAAQTAGVVVTGGTLKTGTIGGGTNKKGEIGFATADISGGNIQGQFILANTDIGKKCTFTMTGGTIDNLNLGMENYTKAQENGGAVYLSDSNGEVSIRGNSILKNCSGTNGGAIYLSGINGTVDIAGGTIQNCKASQGGAVYMTAGNLKLSGGMISSCAAKNNGGAIYLEDGSVTAAGGTIGQQNNPNTAVNGAGIYMQAGNLTVNNGHISYNNAGENGAGIYLGGGNLTINGGNISNNTAAANGGGACLSGGQLTINNGSLAYNTATNGGGAYLSGGQLIINDGSVTSNTAANGGGAYISDGKIRMFGGTITGNQAAADGGGMYVSSENQAADVIIRSGVMSSNTAGTDEENTSAGSGGAIAVVSKDGTARADHVVVGLCETHTDLNTTTDSSKRTFTAFTYTESEDSTAHTHASCPVLTGNHAAGNGGGIYMGSTQAELDIYCLQESGNVSDTDSAGNSVMANGGKVTIGDESANKTGGNPASARGNININSSMLVAGGTVDIYGNMENPYFADNILVKMQQGAGIFEDHRRSASNDKKEYKIHYFENFKGSGTYTAKQYEQTETIPAEGALFVHEGWKIKEWNTKSDGNGTSYTIGTTIGSEKDHTAWTSGSGADEDAPLILYAIWEKITYTVEFNSNAAQGENVSGTMAKQTFKYAESISLSPNTFHINGKRFNGWNTEADGTGISYKADYSDSTMTSEDGATIKLYAQWVTCTHKGGEHQGTLTYTKDESNKSQPKITETCDCGGHTVTVTLSAVDVNYDQKAHPATVTITGDTLFAEKPTIQYKYKGNAEDEYGSMTENTTEPVEVGYYQASITIENQTVTVEYQIKSPSEGASIEAKKAKGQVFKEFKDETDVKISVDDAFTVQFTVQNLPVESYTAAPVLTFSQELQTGTTIIMQTYDSNNTCKYWKNTNATGMEIQLSSFTEMGGTQSFDYDTIKSLANQTYRFIVDFSKTQDNIRISGDLTSALKYTYGTDVFESTASVKMENAGTFSLSKKSDETSITITAPSSTANSRWEDKTLVMVLSPSGQTKLPGDAVVTMNADNTTQSFWPDSEGNFVVPLTWKETQTVNLSLNSETADAKGESYTFTAKLYTGSKNSQNLITAKEYETNVSLNDLSLVIPSDQSPSLKITGDQRLVKRTDGELILAVKYENVEGCTISANIQQKSAAGEYEGTFLQAENVINGENKFSLRGVTAAGSYRLVITVTKDNQIILTVPYYFIVQ